MHKQTKLDDNSSIYQPREKQTEKEKLREMSFRKKLEYLFEYYKFHALITIAVIAFIIYIINGILNPPAVTKFNAAIIDNPVDEKIINQYAEDFAKLLNLNPARENVELNTSYNFSIKDTYTATLKDALVARISARDVDVIIAPESEFKNYAKTGCLIKLSDLLPTDIYSSLTDKFFISNTNEDSEQTAYGIYLSNTKFIKENAKKTDVKLEPYVIGVITNTRHVDNSVEFIRYLFNEK
jgi:hypothetical protein